jgi:hypothetical protein
VLGDLELLAAPLGETEVRDFEVREFGGGFGEGGGHESMEFGVLSIGK